MQGPIGVQSLVDSGILKLPENYVRPQEERPTTEPLVPHNNFKLSIPIIDLSKLDGTERASTLDSIHQACRDWGFFQATFFPSLKASILRVVRQTLWRTRYMYLPPGGPVQVVNHGVPATLMQRMKEVADQFFALPLEEKQDFKAQPGRHRCAGKFGTSFNPGRDAVLDWRDVVRHYFSAGWEADTGVWPEKPPLYKEAVLAYHNAVTSLAQKLLSLMAENLGLPSNAFETASGEQHFHWVYYPPCPEPELALGIKSHTDSGALTVLQQDEVGGLQVSKDGQWISVEPIPSAFVINLADAMQVLTNDEYASVDHRAVVNIHKPRLSLVTFYTPEPSQILSPTPGLLTQQHPAVYGSFTFKEYLQALFEKGLDGKKVLTRFRLEQASSKDAV